MGFQLGVASALPGEKGYSPLYYLNFVKWKIMPLPRILKSVDEIMSAQKNGELTICPTNIVINSHLLLSCQISEQDNGILAIKTVRKQQVL